MARDEQTDELRIVQDDRRQDERTLAHHAADPDEEAVHDRRAERAEYLRRRLDERAESEDAVDDEPGDGD